MFISMLINNENIKNGSSFFFFTSCTVNVLLTYSTCSSYVAAKGCEGTHSVFGVLYVETL